MKYRNVAEIYESNEEIQADLKTVLENLSDELASTPISGEKWSVAEVLEHTAIVEEIIIGFCSALLTQALESSAGKSNGEVNHSVEFIEGIKIQRNRKFDAPEKIQPTGTKTLSESLRKLEENVSNLARLRRNFETIDVSRHKIPHVILGDLTAHEWLFLVGEHKNRHLSQIKALLGKSS